ncbi:MAG: SPOR domain-containing protein [Hyphomicrobiales bacterium]
MSLRKTSVQSIDLDDFERRLREIAVSSLPRKNEDSLAKLARIVGRDKSQLSIAGGRAEPVEPVPSRARALRGSPGEVRPRISSVDQAEADIAASIKELLLAARAQGRGEEERQPAFDLDAAVSEPVPEDGLARPCENDVPPEQASAREEAVQEPAREQPAREQRSHAEPPLRAPSRVGHGYVDEGRTLRFGAGREVQAISGAAAAPRVGTARRGISAPMLAFAASLALVAAVTGAMVLMRAVPAGWTGGDVPVVKADEPPAKAQAAEVASSGKAAPGPGAADALGKPVEAQASEPAGSNNTASAQVPAATAPAPKPSEPAPAAAAAALSPAPSAVAAAQPPALSDVVAASGAGAAASPAPPQLPTIGDATALQPAVAEPVATIAPIPPIRPTEPARARLSDATNAAGASSYSIKLASRLTERDARAALSQLQKQFPGLLGGASVTKDDLGKEGVFYRVRTGPLSRDAADKLCSQLKTAVRGCAPKRG